MSRSPDDRLGDLGLHLPPPGAPLASYVPLVITGKFAFVSGHGPLNSDRSPAFAGRLGRDLSDTDAIAAARLTTLNLLATLRNGLGTLNVINRFVELRCFLAAEPSGNAHTLVPRAITQLLRDIFGPAAADAYTTIGISGSVLNLPVTVDLVAAINPASGSGAF